MTQVPHVEVRLAVSKDTHDPADHFFPANACWTMAGQWARPLSYVHCLSGYVWESRKTSSCDPRSGVYYFFWTNWSLSHVSSRERASNAIEAKTSGMHRPIKPQYQYHRTRLYRLRVLYQVSSSYVVMLQPNCGHHTATNRFFCFYTTLYTFTLRHIS